MLYHGLIVSRGYIYDKLYQNEGELTILNKFNDIKSTCKTSSN